VVVQGESLFTARHPSGDLAALRAFVGTHRPRVLGATGGGAALLGDAVEGVPVVRVSEFAAWARGAPLLAAAAGIELPAQYLLVSLGTGTSILHVWNAEGSERVGGTALGGGTLSGLGRLLLGSTTFAELATSAARGDRRRADLLVGDIYRGGGIELPRDLNAASFGKLATTSLPEPRREDLAHALMGLVGENVSLLATALAGQRGVSTVVYCGTPVEGSPELAGILLATTEAFGATALTLPRGSYCGAVGAAALARIRPTLSAARP